MARTRISQPTLCTSTLEVYRCRGTFLPQGVNNKNTDRQQKHRRVLPRPVSSPTYRVKTSEPNLQGAQRQPSFSTRPQSLLSHFSETTSILLTKPQGLLDFFSLWPRWQLLGVVLHPRMNSFWTWLGLLIRVNEEALLYPPGWDYSQGDPHPSLLCS